jgi:hypothetical protein
MLTHAVTGKRITVADLALAFARVSLRNACTKKVRTPIQRGSTRFPGIGRDAERLGVNRVTLYRTLTGAYRLPGLASRYAELKRKAS